MKTENELKQEWGQERFVAAMGVLANWQSANWHQGWCPSEEQILELHAESEDALELFTARLFTAGLPIDEFHLRRFRPVARSIRVVNKIVVGETSS